MSDGSVIETFHYEIEQRDDGWWTRFINPVDPKSERAWIGPYPTEDRAHEAVKASLDAVLSDFTKLALGL